LWWVKSNGSDLLDILFERYGSVGSLFDIMDDIFADILNRMCTINCDMFNGFGTFFSGVLDCVGEVCDKAKLREDRGEEEWGENEEFH
jgi:hypothetical protein